MFLQSARRAASSTGVRVASRFTACSSRTAGARAPYALAFGNPLQRQIASVAPNSSTARLCQSVRSFSSGGEESTEQRVIKAVEKYIHERADDLRKELQETNMEDGSDAKKKLQDQLTALENILKDGKGVSPDLTWSELHFDEFDQVEVLLEVEEAFGGHYIPDEKSDTIAGVKETIEYFESELKADEAEA